MKVKEGDRRFIKWGWVCFTWEDGGEERGIYTHRGRGSLESRYRFLERQRGWRDEDGARGDEDDT